VSTVSAHPFRLLAFAASNRQRSLELRPTAADLEEHLRRLPARCPGFSATHLADDVRAAGHDLDRLADLVEEAAHALLDADTAWFTRYGGLLANLRGIGLIWRAVDGTGPAAGRIGVTVFIGRTIADAKDLVDQGNPFRAFQRRGTDYLADVEQVRLDALLVLLGTRPSPLAAVAAAISFRTWAELATLDERRRIALAGVRGVDRLQDAGRDLAVDGLHRATDWLRTQLDGGPFGGGRDRGPVVVPPLLPLPRPFRTVAHEVLDRVDGTVEHLDDAADGAAGTARRAAKGAARAVSRASDAVLDAGARAVDALPWPR